MKGRVTCEARNCKRINGQQRLFSLHAFANYGQYILITAHAVSLDIYKISILMCIVCLCITLDLRIQHFLLHVYNKDDIRRACFLSKYIKRAMFCKTKSLFTKQVSIYRTWRTCSKKICWQIRMMI